MGSPVAGAIRTFGQSYGGMFCVGTRPGSA